MKKNYERFDHLIKNLDRISIHDSIFNYKSGEKALLSLQKGNYRKWLNTLLPNTRLILEPKIKGIWLAIFYENGKLRKAINKNSEDKTEAVLIIKNIPKSIPIKHNLQIFGELYHFKNKNTISRKNDFYVIQGTGVELEELNFCAYHIFNCKLNHYQSLIELKNLNFEIPDTEFTNFISDVEIYLECWKEGKLFTKYPTNGLVMKINSRKLQKQLGENNVCINWAFAIE